MWYANFEVTGAGYFPFDMLRYDACYPINGEAVDRISFNVHNTSREEFTGLRTIMLGMRTARREECKPTEDRWQSFGWRVVSRTAPRKV